MTKDHMFENEFENAIGETWTTIPNDIMRSGKDIFASMGEKMTYLVCLSYSFKIGNEARPSQKTLAHDAICTDRAIRNFLSRLEEKGFLKKMGYHESNGTVVWRVLIPNELKLKWLEEKVIRAKAEIGMEVPQQPEAKPEPKEDPKPVDNIPYKEIIGYLNEKAGKNYNFKTESYRKAIRTHFNNGYTVNDFKTVIDNMVTNWTGTIFKKSGKPGETYLKPLTLFGPKFDEYLNDTPKQQPQQKPLFAEPKKQSSSVIEIDGKFYDLKNPDQREKAMQIKMAKAGLVNEPKQGAAL